MTKEQNNTINREYFDILILALNMKREREKGNTFIYEGMLFRFALEYSELFKQIGKFDMDRAVLLSELKELLPEYFGNNFDNHGTFISND